jgi:surface protein
MELTTILKNEYGFNFHASAKHITFTDQPAPAGVETRDMSETKDKGVVGWMQGDTYYVSTQRPGVKVIAPVYSSHLFTDLDTQSINIAMLDTSAVTDMSSLFEGCKSLASLDVLALWDTHNVTLMFGLFHHCASLENVDALSHWDVSSVTTMTEMFYGCAALPSESVEKFKAHHVKLRKGISLSP